MGLPKEVLDQLPKNVKIKKVTINLQTILKVVVYGMLLFWLLGAARSVFTNEAVERVGISQVVNEIKNGNAEEVTIVDNEVLVKIKDSNTILVTSKEPNESMTEILQREGVDLANVNIKVETGNGGSFLEIFCL